MRKSIFIPLILFCIILPAVAQSTQSAVESQNTYNRIVLKLNYSNVNSRQIVPVYTNQPITLEERFYEKNSHYGFECLYRFNKLWTAGIYLGYSNGTFISNEILSSGSDNYHSTIDRFGRSYFYGLKAEIQILPLLMNAEKFRLNVYCPVQLGLVSQQITTFADNSKNWDKPAFEAGAGLGISYNFTRNIGIFGEYQLGHFYNNRKSQLKAGAFVTF
jgi:hypothetical protein